MVNSNDPIYKIIEELEKYKDIEEDTDILNDIDILNKMINGNIPYNESLVNNIRSKYQAELQFLSNLEEALRNFQVNQNTRSDKSCMQYLLNTRHALVRVQVMRILKRKSKKMLEDDLINNDNKNLYNKFILAMNS